MDSFKYQLKNNLLVNLIFVIALISFSFCKENPADAATRPRISSTQPGTHATNGESSTHSFFKTKTPWLNYTEPWKEIYPTELKSENPRAAQKYYVEQNTFRKPTSKKQRTF